MTEKSMKEVYRDRARRARCADLILWLLVLCCHAASAAIWLHYLQGGLNGLNY